MDAPQTMSEASPANLLAGGAGGAPSASQSDPRPADLDDRIIAAFADGAKSADVSRLLSEVEAAANAADAVAKAARQRAMDPMLARDAVTVARAK
jgi:hypothetical protein